MFSKHGRIMIFSFSLSVYTIVLALEVYGLKLNSFYVTVSSTVSN